MTPAKISLKKIQLHRQLYKWKNCPANRHFEKKVLYALEPECMASSRSENKDSSALFCALNCISFLARTSQLLFGVGY